jgi:hypothetical protein
MLFFPFDEGFFNFPKDYPFDIFFSNPESSDYASSPELEIWK